ncbi:MAG: hypothetical protein IPQ19_09275 [Bacteroidetes bacterium]|nr:hypothetical protein [Bacteroidota bacterium]
MDDAKDVCVCKLDCCKEKCCQGKDCADCKSCGASKDTACSSDKKPAAKTLLNAKWMKRRAVNQQKKVETIAINAKKHPPLPSIKKSEKSGSSLNMENANYFCPMKCEGGFSNAPSKCVKCGMDLKKRVI